MWCTNNKRLHLPEHLKSKHLNIQMCKYAHKKLIDSVWYDLKKKKNIYPNNIFYFKLYNSGFCSSESETPQHWPRPLPRHAEAPKYRQKHIYYIYF